MCLNKKTTECNNIKQPNGIKPPKIQMKMTADNYFCLEKEVFMEEAFGLKKKHKNTLHKAKFSEWTDCLDLLDCMGYRLSQKNL